MQLTRHQTSASGDRVISFPRLECWNPMTKVVTLAAEVNKKRVLCLVSLEVLSDKFGAPEQEPMRFVAQHRMAIQEAARKLIENEVYEEDGSVLIRARDL